MVDLSTFGVPKGGDRYYEKVIYSLALLYNVLSSEIAAYLKEYNLTIGKMNILMAIKHQGGKEGIMQVEISKHLIVTPSNMTKMIHKLEKEKLVSRHALAGDRRVNIIKITPKGSDLLDLVWKGYDAKLRSLIKNMSVDQQKVLADMLMDWLNKTG